jgi:DNA-binding IclR family transcriptional regulator
MHPLALDAASQPQQTRPVGAGRVLLVLKELARHPKGVALDRLARELEIPKSSLHRVLAALRSAQLAEHDDRGHYRLSLEFVRLAFEYYQALDRSALVLPALEALVDRFEETAHYAELDGDEIVYVAKVDPRGSAVRMSSVVGGRNPAHCTGIGKALLAHTLTDRAAVDRYVAEHAPLPRRTDRTLVSADELDRELTDVRARGFAVDDQESEPGVNCIAFPIFLESAERPAGAISLAALVHRTQVAELIASAADIRAVIDAHLGAVTQ